MVSCGADTDLNFRGVRPLRIVERENIRENVWRNNRRGDMASYAEPDNIVSRVVNTQLVRACGGRELFARAG